MNWWRRNAVILIPAALLLAYAAVYVLAFPRYRFMGKASVRMCSYEWQMYAWYPMFWSEDRLRDDFGFDSWDHFGGRDPKDSFERLWP